MYPLRCIVAKFVYPHLILIMIKREKNNVQFDLSSFHLKSTCGSYLYFLTQILRNLLNQCLLVYINLYSDLRNQEYLLVPCKPAIWEELKILLLLNLSHFDLIPMPPRTE